jgi:hypothetical protein
VILEIAKWFGPVCVDPDDGGQLCSEVAKLLEQGHSVCLDFTGVTTLTSSFLNAAIGCLYGTFGAEDLSERLTWTGLDETDESIVRLVQRNAIRYFKAQPADRERLETVGLVE